MMNVPAIMKGMQKKKALHPISKDAGLLEFDLLIVPQYWIANHLLRGLKGILLRGPSG